MTRIERNWKDKQILLPYALLWLTLTANFWMRTRNEPFVFSPLNILMLGLFLFMICHIAAKAIWLFRNPFALIDQDRLVISVAPFQKEVIKIHEITKAREILSREAMTIFGFKSEYDNWVLMFDTLNNMTTTISLRAYLDKREHLLRLLTENNIPIEKDV